MRCPDCAAVMKSHKATKDEPYHYTASGLADLYLCGITVSVCSQCGGEMPIIPRIEELHQVVAQMVAEKGTLLRGDEVRFLRKFAGLRANEFAARLGIDPSHLSRVENGGTPHLGPGTDKLARAVALAESDAERTKAILRRDAEIHEALKRRAKIRVRFIKDRNHWSSANVAVA